MLETAQKILILAPHTDDGEFGCGGSISKWIEEGKEVFYATFSACKQSVLPQFPEDILITEVKAATATLGIPSKNLILYDYEVRTFNYRRQEILDDLIKLRTKLKPDLGWERGCILGSHRGIGVILAVLGWISNTRCLP